MIPIRLSLKNFLSYGEDPQELDFTRFRIACLSGRNGHGKSALLDAITWVLWGQGRVSAADDLVHLHRSSMEVDFEFELEGQRYRVVRKRTRGRTGQSDLQFQLRDGESGWKALTGQGVRQTQERITGLLRMDYETFVNSSFILQGRADDFARKTPGERKRILGEILNLGQYDELAAKARARARDRAVRCQALEAEIARLDAEARSEADLSAEVKRLEHEGSEARLAVEGRRADLNQVRIEKTALDARRREREDLQRRLAAAAKDLERLRQSQATAETRLLAARTLIERAEAIRARDAEWQSARARLQSLQDAARAARQLEQRCIALERELQEKQRDLEVKIGVERQAVAQLVARQAQLPEAERRTAEARGHVAALDALAEEERALQPELERLAAARAAAEADGKRLAEALESADDRFAMLKGSEASCPVCDTPLTAESRRALGWKLRDERKALAADRDAAQKREKEAAASIAAARKRGQEIQRDLRAGQAWRTKLAQAEHEITQIREEGPQLDARRGALAALEKELAEGSATTAQRQELARRREELARLGYDEEAHHAAERAAAALEGADGQLKALEQAEREAPAVEAERRAAEESRAVREGAIAEDTAALAEADRALARAEAVDAEAVRLEQALGEAETQHAALTRDLGSAQESLARCREQALLLKERKAEREQAACEQANYEQLEKAFGRNGLQALIIENAIPEIEQEANSILARISGNEMRVGLRTQRDTRTAGVAETLEIEISDTLGARRYELFSGGEAFRISFALRIGLSKLLARRAGARLQTLVIDEGFGSQDAEGRDRLVEAILAVEEEFARILVITHVDELKELFPTWIEITKTPAGSQIVVV